jgi:Mitochondrial domain of unknown function (DUF1713)
LDDPRRPRATLAAPYRRRRFAVGRRFGFGRRFAVGQTSPVALPPVMGSLIKKRRKRMRKKKHRKMLKRTRFQRRNK